MITILYFARLREALGRSSEQKLRRKPLKVVVSNRPRPHGH